MSATIKEQLIAMAEPEFQKFSSQLLPGTNNILGVRLPKLRKLAKKIAREDGTDFLKKCAEDSFEEVMLQGMVIGYLKISLEEILSLTEVFVPKIDNWSVCDSFCSGLKVARAYPEKVWLFLQPYLKKEEEYQLRFGIVMLIFYYIDKEHIKKVLELLDSVKHKGYYVKMAAAWAVSICYVKFPEITLEYLKNNTLDEFTYNKALQKIIESHCVNKEEKDVIRQMKRKGL